MIAHLARSALALLLAAMLLARPAMAQSILRDAETEAFLNEISAPLIEAAGLRPENVEIVIIDDPSINAFVAGGQIVYLHSGLIAEADHVGQLQSVIAHELGHIEGGHVIRMRDGMSKAGNISLASMILGAAAIAAGAGEAGMGIFMAGQQAATYQFLAFTRVQETSADLAGARYLSAAGLSGKGSLEFFRKLENQELRLNIPQQDSYARTHPLSRERIATLTDVYQRDPAWERPIDAEDNARFKRVKAKLVGYVDPARAARDYADTDTTVPALYARAYAYHRGGYPAEALAKADALVASNPDDPYFQELKGQILLESGRPEEAIEPLRNAHEMTGGHPLVAVTLGHALIAREQPEQMAEAKRILRAAVHKDRENGFAWYQLGVIYDREGDTARAALATAERFHLMREHKLALASARHAMNLFEHSGPDWLRAQDIAMVSEAAIEKLED